MDRRWPPGLVIPPTAALLLYVTGLVLHSWEDGRWQDMAVFGAAALVAVWVWTWWRIDDGITRWWWRAVTAAAGAWLAWVVETTPYLVGAILAVLVLLVLSWPFAGRALAVAGVVEATSRQIDRHQRPRPALPAGDVIDAEVVDDTITEAPREATVTVAEALDAMDDKNTLEGILTAAGLQGLTVLRWQRVAGGITLTVGLDPRTHRHAVIAAAAESIAIATETATGVAVRADDVTVERTRRSGEARIHVALVNILVDDIPPRPWQRTSITEGIWLGLFADGTDTVLHLGAPWPHAEIMGTTGSGKSMTARQLVGRLLCCSDATVWIGGSDKLRALVAPWLRLHWQDPVRYPMPFGWIAGERPEHVREMLVEAYRAIAVRASMPRDGDNLTPSQATPAIIVILEEASTVLKDRSRITVHTGESLSASQIWHRICRLGRSEAVWAVRIDQDGTVEGGGDEGGKIRKLTGSRLCLRTGTDAEGQSVLGHQQVKTSELEGHTMLVRQGPTGRIMQAKVARVEAEDVPAVMRQIARFAGALDEQTASRLGPAYHERGQGARTVWLRAWQAGRHPGELWDEEGWGRAPSGEAASGDAQPAPSASRPPTPEGQRESKADMIARHEREAAANRSQVADRVRALAEPGGMERWQFERLMEANGFSSSPLAAAEPSRPAPAPAPPAPSAPAPAAPPAPSPSPRHAVPEPLATVVAALADHDDAHEVAAEDLAVLAGEAPADAPAADRQRVGGQVGSRLSRLGSSSQHSRDKRRRVRTAGALRALAEHWAEHGRAPERQR